jgi:4-amino-4-deoxy-L-arabinose transferase-like glycosyltransferase
VGFAFVLALTLRVGLALSQGLDAPPKFSAQPDQIDYEQLAWSMSAGSGYVTKEGQPTARRPPGTSLTLLPVYLLFGRSYAAGRLWFCLLSALTCVSAGWLAALAFGADAGVIAAFWLAVYPGHLYYPLHFVSEVPYAFWLTLSSALTIRTLNGSPGAPRFVVPAGAAWALAVLTRPQVILVVPIAALLALIGVEAARRRVLLLAGMMLTLGAVLAPWVLRNTIVMGAPTLSTVGGATFWGANNERVLNDPSVRGSWVQTSDLEGGEYLLAGSEVQKERAAWAYGRQFLVRHWRSVPGLLAMKLWRLVSPFEHTDNAAVWWAFALAWLLTVPWAAAGIRFAFRDREVADAVLLVPLVATVATAIVFYGSVRFRDAVIPLIVVLAARAMAEFRAVAHRPAMARALCPQSGYRARY